MGQKLTLGNLKKQRIAIPTKLLVRECAVAQRNGDSKLRIAITLAFEWILYFRSDKVRLFDKKLKRSLKCESEWKSFTK